MKQDVSVPSGWIRSQPIWEFEEWYEGKQYWAEMDPKYVAQLNDAYNCKDLVEYEMYDEDWWYEWHLDIMTQYRYFYKEEWYGQKQYWALKCRSRSIRKIIVLHIASDPQRLFC